MRYFLAYLLKTHVVHIVPHLYHIVLFTANLFEILVMSLLECNFFIRTSRKSVSTGYTLNSKYLNCNSLPKLVGTAFGIFWYLEMFYTNTDMSTSRD